MILESKLEFRGSLQTKSKDGEKTYNFVNVEDLNGESAKFLCDCPINDLKKGQKYNFIFDYSTKYGSIKIVNIGG